VQIKLFAITVYTSLLLLWTGNSAFAQTDVNAGPEADTENPAWATPAPPDSDSPLLNVMQAVSGKPQGLKTTTLLEGVVEVKRTATGIAFVRCDQAVLECDEHTKYGAKIFADWEKSAVKANKNVGPEAADFIRGLMSIKSTGHHIEVERKSQDCEISLNSQHKQKSIRLKSVHLSKLSFTIEKEKGQLWIKHLKGVEAVVNSGKMQIPLQLKEFSRHKNIDGQTVLTFGVMPTILLPFRALLIVPESFRVSFIVK
jgi:hypothetical protein